MKGGQKRRHEDGWLQKEEKEEMNEGRKECFV